MRFVGVFNTPPTEARLRSLNWVYEDATKKYATQSPQPFCDFCVFFFFAIFAWN